MYREKMAIAIIQRNYSFSYVEHGATRKLHKFLHRDANPILRNTAKLDVLAIYKREKANLKLKLEKVSSMICFMSDLWSSITIDGYMALTAHYVDEDWLLRKKVLNFRVVPPPHTGTILASVLINFLLDWGIDKKVFTLTLDNAKYNDGLVENLIAGLKVIEGSIEKVRDSVKYVRGSSGRKKCFKACIEHLHLQCGRHVCQDVVTRWNSTYMMLDCALGYQNAYARLKLVDTNYESCPSEDEWIRIKKITNFDTHDDPLGAKNANVDEGNKVDELDELGGFESFRSRFRRVETSDKSELTLYLEEPEISRKTKIDVLQFWKENQASFDTHDDPLGAKNENVDEGNTMDELDELGGFESFRSHFRRFETSDKSELTLYLEELEISRKTKIDVLQFWKENQARYPRLSLMARDLLSVQITIVASESSFSIGGRILSKYRSSLSPSNAEALLCTCDWLDSKDDEEELSEDIENYKDD
nr:zinc finger BED domain-containing protein RICESLEEPER 2-like [Tanacetum cinerariifolium]